MASAFRCGSTRGCWLLGRLPNLIFVILTRRWADVAVGSVEIIDVSIDGEARRTTFRNTAMVAVFLNKAEWSQNCLPGQHILYTAVGPRAYHGQEGGLSPPSHDRGQRPQ